MCSFAVRIKKLSQIAAEAEYELTLEIARKLFYSTQSGSIDLAELAGARRELVLRGDSWALAAFDRIRAYLKERPELCEKLARLKGGTGHGKEETLQEFMELPTAPEDLLCHEVAGLIRDLEAVPA